MRFPHTLVFFSNMKFILLCFVILLVLSLLSVTTICNCWYASSVSKCVYNMYCLHQCLYISVFFMMTNEINNICGLVLNFITAWAVRWYLHLHIKTLEIFLIVWVLLIIDNIDHG